MASQSSEDEEDTTIDDLNKMAADLVAKREAVTAYTSENIGVFTRLKDLKAELKAIRELIRETMTEAELEKFDSANGLKFKATSKMQCKFTAKSLTESVGEEALAKYKRKHAENREFLTIKKIKV